MAVFEFVSLTCIKPSELDGDEVYIEYNGVKVFPGPDQTFRSFRAGTKIVNTEAGLASTALHALATGADTTELKTIVGADKLRRAGVPDTGLLVRVMDYDTFGPDDVLGTLLVSDLSETGIQERTLHGDGGEYVISYLVSPGTE